MSRPSSMQPKSGEIVLHCEHARETVEPRRTFRVGTHWLRVTSPFMAPDGETGVAKWLNCCDLCYRGIGGDLTRLKEIEIHGHVIWDGNAPIIVEDYS